MGRNEEIDLRLRHRGGHRAMRERLADRACDVGIRDEFAKAQGRDGAPRRDLKVRSAQRKRKVEARQPAGKIGLDLRPRLGEQCVARFACASPGRRHEITRKYRFTVAYNQQIASEWRRNA
jgi:hypothetical protein